MGEVQSSMAVKMRSGALHIQGSDRWYVTDGANSVGPVRLELLTAGVEGGRVPLDSFVRHEGWKVWRPLTDFTDFIEIEERAASGMAPTSRDPSSRDPLPQFPLSDRGLAANGGLRTPSLIEFARAEGVPSRRSTDSEPAPSSPRLEKAAPSPRSSAEVAIAPSSWLDEEEESMPGTMRTPMLPPARNARGLPRESANNAHGSPCESENNADDPRAGWSLQRSATSDFASDLSEDLLADDPLELGASFDRNEQASTDDVPTGRRGWGVARPAESTDALPDDDLRGADDLEGAMQLLLAGVAKRAGAEIILMHRMGDHGATVVEAFGSFDDIGVSTTFVDPIVVAAAAGNVVLAEPHPGAAGASMLRRLSPNRWDERELTGPELPPGEATPVASKRPIVAALMLPIQVSGRLFGFVEIGRAAPFAIPDIAKAHAIVAAFTRFIETRGIAV